MRQLGVGVQGGAEAFAIFQQLLYDEWAAGRLEKPFGAGQSRRTKLFRGAAIERNPKGRARESPRHHAVTCGRICSRRWWNSLGSKTYQRTWGAEQGDVDGRD